MGYTIEYQPEDNIRYPPVKKEKAHTKTIAVLVVCVLLLLSSLIWGEDIFNFLLPGDAEITKAALANMVEEIGEGVQVGEAMAAFCSEIYEAGEY